MKKRYFTDLTLAGVKILDILGGFADCLDGANLERKTIADETYELSNAKGLRPERI